MENLKILITQTLTLGLFHLVTCFTPSLFKRVEKYGNWYEILKSRSCRGVYGKITGDTINTSDQGCTLLITQRVVSGSFYTTELKTSWLSNPFTRERAQRAAFEKVPNWSRALLLRYRRLYHRWPSPSFMQLRAFMAFRPLTLDGWLVTRLKRPASECGQFFVHPSHARGLSQPLACTCVLLSRVNGCFF